MTPSASPAPALSIVIASRDAENTIEACLRSLCDQETDKDYEIVVVDSSTDATAQLIQQGFPEVKLYHFAERKYCGDARNIGISGARSEIIALTDADCEAPRTWVDDVLEAHRSPHLAIGGAIGNAKPANLVGWAAYFCEFSNWMPRSQPRELDDIAAANMSYKRAAFATYGPFIEGTYCSDSEFHWRLGREGHRLRFLPHIVVSHRSINDFGEFVAHEFEHGACFARVRTAAQGFSGARRLGYVLLGPLIPFKVLLQVVNNNLTTQVYLRQFLKTLPLVALGILSWSAGEVVGYAGR
jgi:glycosyltransferase involved in cell wall biosynthesis